jgi:hypothetical protein
MGKQKYSPGYKRSYTPNFYRKSHPNRVIWISGRVKKEHLHCLKRNFPFHQLFLDLFLSGSYLKRREFKERGSHELRGKRTLSALNF